MSVSKLVVLSIAIFVCSSTAVEGLAAPTSPFEPAQTVRLKTKKRSKYVVRKTKSGSRTVARKSVRGTKKVGRTTWRGGRKVVSRTKKILW